MKSIRKELAEMIVGQRELNARVEAGRQAIASMEIRLQKYCNNHRVSNFGVEILASLTSGSLTPNWSPCAFVYPYYESAGDRTYAKISGQWCWYDGCLSIGGSAYPHRILKNRKPPFDGAALEAACAELAEDLGIPIEIVEGSLAQAPGRPKNKDDILVMLPNSEIVAEGNIWTMGWDIPDRWAIARTEEGLHVFWSTDGHGFGYDRHAKPGEPLKDFFDQVEGDGFEGAEAVVAAILTASGATSSDA